MSRAEQSVRQRQSRIPITPIIRAGLTLMIATTMAVAGSSAAHAEAPQPASERVDLLTRQFENPDGQPLVVAHRACWQGTAENSLQAIAKCIKHGVDMVEIDVRRTSDGELVVIHDRSLDRTTTGTGPVSAMKLADLRRLKLRSDRGGPGSHVIDYGIPTLREALEACRGKILVNVDAKEDIHAEAIALITDMRIQHQVLMKKVIVHPNEDDLLRRKIRFFMPVIDQRVVISAADAVRSYREHPPVAFEIVFQSEKYLLDAMPEMKRGKARVWVNTLSPDLAGGMTDDQAAATWGRLLDHGVNILQTNRPVELIEFLRATGRRVP